MRRLPLLLPFSFALLYALFGLSLFPKLHLHPFAPFLALLCYKSPLIKTLWLSSLAGLCIDLCTSQLYFGLYALNYCMTTLLLYKHQRHFFEDKPFSIPLFSILISSLSSLIELMFLSLTGPKIPLTGRFLTLELCVMPLADGLYAYLWFFLPAKGFLYLKKHGIKSLIKKVWLVFYPKEG